MIGIQSALGKETDLIRERIEYPELRRCGGLECVVGSMDDTRIVAVAGGVGKVAAAACAQILIDVFEVESIVVSGVAGLLNPELNVGDIVISRDVLHCDRTTDTEEAVPGRTGSRFCERRLSADENLARFAESACAEMLGGDSYVVGTIVTSDKPVLTPRERERLWRRYRAECVDMEGAAVAAVCERNGIPFLVLRAISDSAGFLTPLEFMKNFPETSKKTQKVLLKMLELKGQC